MDHTNSLMEINVALEALYIFLLLYHIVNVYNRLTSDVNGIVSLHDSVEGRLMATRDAVIVSSIAEFFCRLSLSFVNWRPS